MLSLVVFIGVGGKAQLGSTLHFQLSWQGLCGEACLLSAG